MDSAQIAKMFDAIQQANHYVHSLVIVRNGDIVTEANYAPFRSDAPHNIITITESVVSVLVGVAIQQGLIKGVDQKMLDFFPDYKIANLDARKQAITIGDLLTMTSGFRIDDGGNGIILTTGFSINWTCRWTHEPGTMWDPTRGGYILLAAIIQKATGMTALAFANKYLFGPLGISGAVWETDPHGIENGGNRLYIALT